MSAMVEKALPEGISIVNIQVLLRLLLFLRSGLVLRAQIV